MKRQIIGSILTVVLLVLPPVFLPVSCSDGDDGQDMDNIGRDDNDGDGGDDDVEYVETICHGRRKVMADLTDVTGTVIFSENCGFEPQFELRPDDSTEYFNFGNDCGLLPEEFRIEGTRVRFSGRIFEPFELEVPCTFPFELSEIELFEPCFKDSGRKVMADLTDVTGTIDFEEGCGFMLRPDLPDRLDGTPGYLKLGNGCDLLPEEFKIEGIEGTRVRFSGRVFEVVNLENRCAGNPFELSGIELIEPCFKDSGRKVMADLTDVTGTVDFEEDCGFMLRPDGPLENNLTGPLFVDCELLPEEFRIEGTRVRFSGRILETFELEDFCSDAKLFELSGIESMEPELSCLQRFRDSGRKVIANLTNVTGTVIVGECLQLELQPDGPLENNLTGPLFVICDLLPEGFRTEGTRVRFSGRVFEYLELDDPCSTAKLFELSGIELIEP